MDIRLALKLPSPPPPPGRESTTIGFLLNTKGLVELVALNVGLDIGVLSEQVFAIFVVMALWCVTLLS